MAYKNFIILLTKNIFFRFAILFILIFANSCNNKNNDTIITCSVEKANSDYVLADNDTIFKFKDLKIRTDKFFHSGKYSLKLDSIHSFAFSTKIKLTSKNKYQLSFWKYGDSENIFAVVQLSKKFYLNSNVVIKKDSLGWQKIQLSFQIPDSLSNNLFGIYVWNSSKKEIYVDDFELKKQTEQVELQSSNDLFFIYINEKDFDNIKKQRDDAVKIGVLNTDDNSWVKGMGLFGDETYKVKLRLKGDWIDHLMGKKWSYRIKIKSNKYFKGMQIFSIQNPTIRFYIAQWLFYKLCRDEDILAPRSGFVNVQVNNQYSGIYFYEEFFEKQLIESLKRREGPILCFNEEPMWAVMTKNLNNKNNYKLPVFNASHIEPFGSGKTLKDSTLKNEFLIAQNLLLQHKNSDIRVSELFDVDKLAKYYALANVFAAFHGLVWNNQRFYYNPIISKLEPIAFDNYINNGIYHTFSEPILGFFDFKTYIKWTDQINFYIFSDSIFAYKYLFYLEKFSNPNYLDSVFNANSYEINSYETSIQKEYQEYIFDKQVIKKQAQSIQNLLPRYKKVITKYFDYSFKQSDTSQYKTSNPIFIKTFVKAFLQFTDGKKSLIRIANYYSTNLKVVKYIKKGRKYKIDQIQIASYCKTRSNFKTDITIKDIPDSLIVSDGTNEYSIKINLWQEPYAWSPRQELEQNNKFPNEKYYKVIGKKVIFRGKQTISNIIIIPAGFEVEFLAGTQIDFINGGAFLSNSNVQMNGTSQQPIHIKSSDNSGRGFTILQAPKVNMNYVTFDGMNTFSYKGWNLTGSVTIYECNSLKIDNCSFINNKCEDDLNLVRSNYKMTNCLFENTFSDALDNDFCVGSIDKCTFIQLGNDAMDLSTSQISISNCSILNATDKGISGGEDSHLTINNCTIKNANIGFASKDKSELLVNNCKIQNTVYGFTIFQKKPEYGEASIIANNIIYTDIVKYLLIEKDSWIILDSKKIDGQEKNVANKFY